MIDISALKAGTAALIGHTGLVGSNLVRQFRFADCYNSSNIGDIGGRRYDLLVCSGARGTKWIANRDPQADIAGIESLTRHLDRVQAANLILISTVDVYGVPARVDEDTAIDESTQTAYGRHRYQLERHVCDRFPRVLIVRLPGLFGQGLKKNALYDLMWNHEVEKIHPEASYQFYGLEHAGADIVRLAMAGASLGNLVTEPLPIQLVAQQLFGVTLTMAQPGAPAAYDVRTKHAAVFGGANGYLKDSMAVMNEIREFVASSRLEGRTP